jgi:hypothetical protein
MQCQLQALRLTHTHGYKKFLRRCEVQFFLTTLRLSVPSVQLSFIYAGCAGLRGVLTHAIK